MKKILTLKHFLYMVLGMVLGIFLYKTLSIKAVNKVMIEYSGVVDAAEIIAVIITFVSLIVIYFQMKTDHEKSRREKSVELLLKWTNSITKETNAVKKIVEGFDESQCRKLLAEEEFEVHCSLYEDIAEAINEKIEKETYCAECSGPNSVCPYNRKILLKKKHIKKLRWHTITYLNLLESILVAWQYSIVEREIIEHQFSYQVSPREGKGVLENFRKIVGSEESYPAIAIFCSHLDLQRRKGLKEKGNIV